MGFFIFGAQLRCVRTIAPLKRIGRSFVMLGFLQLRRKQMSKEPVAVIDGDHFSVYVYVVDAPGNTFAWEVVESRHSASEVIERKLVSDISYPTHADAEAAGKQKATAVAKGMV